MITRNNIIGQKDLLDRIDALIDSDNFPRFSIIVGGRLSGKKLICSYIADKLGCTYVPCSSKVEDVRQIIDMSNSTLEYMLYVFHNISNMSISAKNALLKITEEPPQNAYFIMNTTNPENILPTILSRGTSFYIQPYTLDELNEYLGTKPWYTEEYKSLLDLCSTPGEVDELDKCNVQELVSFTNKILDNIGVASLPNVLKLANNFNLKKDDTDKYDIQMFFKCVMYIASKRYKDTKDNNYNLLCIETCKIQSEFRTVSINKLAVLDKWLLYANSLFAKR